MAFWNRKVVLDSEIPTRSQAEQRRDQILERFDGLSLTLSELQADVKATSSVRSLQKKLNDLKQAVADYEIQKSKQEEEFARERREIEHHVGLERQRTDLEIENAKTEAKLAAREEALSGKEDLFEEHMTFYKEQMDKHIDDVKLLLNQVMTRIPTVNVDRQIREDYRALTNGDDNGD